MNCIDLAKIEGWLKGADPDALDREALAHLKSCRNCLQSLKIAVALKASAAIPAAESYLSSSLPCVAHIEDEVRLAYLDESMGEGKESPLKITWGDAQPANRRSLSGSTK